MGHLIYNTKENPIIHSNIWEHSYKNKIGEREFIIFSELEIKKAILYFEKIVLAAYIPQNSKSSIKFTAYTSRLARAIYFLQSARISDDIGIKIAHFCSVFESLFSTSTSELRHRLSETIANFIGIDKEDRLSIYKSLQHAYDIRSSIVHGDMISSKFTKEDYKLIFSTITAADNILRKCFQKILDSEEIYELFTVKTKEQVNEFIQGLLFR